MILMLPFWAGIKISLWFSKKYALITNNITILVAKSWLPTKIIITACPQK